MAFYLNMYDGFNTIKKGMLAIFLYIISLFTCGMVI